MNRILGVVVAFLSGSLCVMGADHPGRPQPSSGFRFVASSAESLVVEYRAGAFNATTILVSGNPHLVFAGGGMPGDTVVGSPPIPSESFALGIPWGATARVILDQAEYGAWQPGEIAPVPALSYSDEREAIPAYTRDEHAYAREVILPPAPVHMDPPVVLRSQRLVTVRLATVRYNPARRQIQRLLKARLVVDLQHMQVPALQTAAPPDPAFESIFKSLLLNYEEARRWRTKNLPQKMESADPTRSWFTAGVTYYRIPVWRDGWYRVTKADLLATGTPPPFVDSTTVALYADGNPVPFVQRPDSSIEFYGLRHHGDSTYTDFYTDTLSYWLTFNVPDGNRRYAAAPSLGLPPPRTVPWAVHTLHLEENTDYYEGTGDREVTQNGSVAGEGFVWEYYYPNSSYEHTFSVDSLLVATNVQARLRISFFSTTLNYNIPDHIARVWVNDSLAGEVAFTGRTRGFLNVAFASSRLRNGINRIRITSIPTPSSPNQFYLDWIEIDYPRLLVAAGDQLSFVVKDSAGIQPVRMEVRGFSDSSVVAYDLRRSRAITGGIITGNPTNGFTYSFVDSTGDSTAYLVTSNAGSFSSQGIRAKRFSDLRANSGGADYIIITHPLFREAAEELAAYRRGRSGVRAIIADVQEIYDEFSYGQIDAGALKAYLRYAYEHWPVPAPSTVLLFGDASWDIHRFLASTTRWNFVPAYGVPSGDNWFGCFDPLYPFLPSLLIGRLPVLDPVQAQRVVQKLKTYDAWQPAEWVKTFLLIEGGDTPSEKALFAASSEALISQSILPPPFGGIPLRVYKTSPATIDGENREIIQSYFRQGIVFLNFLGHSGGRIWNVDMGNPSDLQNTDGRLPFVSSVSCNVGAFAEPWYTTLGEDLALADNRGAIAVWGSSSLGYANVGTMLVQQFLRAAAVDSLRAFGALTTLARYRMWQSRGSDYITLASMNLNPLLGDPLTDLAIPRLPELVLEPTGLIPDNETPTVADTNLTVRVRYFNLGLVPPDSVAIRITDTFDGQVRSVAPDIRVPPPNSRDSISVPWKGYMQAGRHIIGGEIDPASMIVEVSKANNSAVHEMTVYTNTLRTVRPINASLVPAGPVELVVSSPFGADSTLLTYEFEIDTSSGFGSPARIGATGLLPNPVGGRWRTPALPAGRSYYWRARTRIAGTVGTWTQSRFRTGDGIEPGPRLTWGATTSSDFAGSSLHSTSVSDSGVILIPQEALKLGARSVGARANADKDYYSILQVGQQTVTGHWWVHGGSFMGLRMNAFTGSFEFRAFDVAALPGEADTMATFIRNAPPGYYVALTVIFDGKTNVNAALKSAIKSLGSVYIDSLQYGHAWMLIGRKGVSGPGMVPLEQWSPTGIASESLYVPNYYRAGKGAFQAAPIPMPVSMQRLRWSASRIPEKTNVVLRLLGIRQTGERDTLRTIPADSTLVDLLPLSASIADSPYVSLAVLGDLSTSDASFTPVVHSWSMDIDAPADIAISPRTVGVGDGSLGKVAAADVPVTIYNIGYMRADSTRIAISLLGGAARKTLLVTASAGRIGVDSSVSVTVSVPTSAFTVPARLLVEISPAGRGRDLLYENNAAQYDLLFTGVGQRLDGTIRVFTNGVPLVDGDYLAAEAEVLVQYQPLSGTSAGTERLHLFMDGQAVVPEVQGTGKVDGRALNEVIRLPRLKDGPHELLVRIYGWIAGVGTDSLQRVMALNVQSDYRILRVYNYPNPFATTTEFTFVLTGARPPDDLTIRIFTIAGRKIHEITVGHGALQIGMNRIPWDGRDRDGDEIANGYYLYQIQVKADGKMVSGIEKMVKLR